MKFAFPVNENRGLENPVYSHFGSAPFFVVLDRSSGLVDTMGVPIKVKTFNHPFPPVTYLIFFALNAAR